MREVVGDARRAVGGPRASRVRARHRASRRAAGVRRRAEGTGRDLRRSAPADPPLVDGRRRRLTTARYFHYEGMTVLPKPDKRLDVWLGGKAPSELRRVGKLADGWLASFSTPEDCKAGRESRSKTAAAAAGRSIDDDHFGAMVFYTHDADPRPASWRCSAARNPGADPRDLVAHGWPAVRELCERFVAVGFSKLVLVPFTEPDNWDDELAAGGRRPCCRSRTDRLLGCGLALRLARRRGSGGGRSSSRARRCRRRSPGRTAPMTNTSWELA